jgi:signal peptidase I
MTSIGWVNAGTALGFGLLVVGAGTLLLRRRYFTVSVKGRSMHPTLDAGERLLARRAPVSRLRTGDIVVVEQPEFSETPQWQWPAPVPGLNGRRWMIKRLAGLPGDPVPAQVAERVLARPGDVVPPGCAVVLGDNVDESTDSREMGYVPIDRVLGVALRRLRMLRRA